MVHGDEVAQFVPNGQKPDGVYGLKRTARLTELLAKIKGNDDLIDYSKFSRFTDEGEASLFPFFVLDSKSVTSKDSTHHIFLQTAFVIRTLLQLQQSLRDINGPNSRSEECPPVWFLSHRGPCWRVSTAYIADGEPAYI